MALIHAKWRINSVKRASNYTILGYGMLFIMIMCYIIDANKLEMESDLCNEF